MRGRGEEFDYNNEVNCYILEVKLALLIEMILEKANINIDLIICNQVLLRRFG